MRILRGLPGRLRRLVPYPVKAAQHMHFFEASFSATPVPLCADASFPAEPDAASKPRPAGSAPFSKIQPRATHRRGIRLPRPVACARRRNVCPNCNILMRFADRRLLRLARRCNKTENCAHAPAGAVYRRCRTVQNGTVCRRRRQRQTRDETGRQPPLPVCPSRQLTGDFQ